MVPGGCKELQRVTSGNRGLLGVSGGYMRRLRIVTKVNRWLQKDTGCSKRLQGFQEVRKVPKGLEGFARGNRGLQEVTEWFQLVARGSMGLQGGTGGYKKL